MVVCQLDRCLFCGGCVAVCLKDAISVYDVNILVDPLLCTGCGNCISVCPTGALKRSHDRTGK